jgi:2-oxoglutarate dehydrogenase E2 component (dihydrolipoamide succinyltransferase)
MPIDIVMPQMGESVAEGTIVRWMKRVGDAVDRDEPLFEISTDKVDAEIPSPDAGVLLEIRVQEGATVPVHTVVGVISTGTTGTTGTTGSGGGVSKVGNDAPSGARRLDVPVVPVAPVAPVNFLSPVVRNMARGFTQGVDHTAHDSFTHVN